MNTKLQHGFTLIEIVIAIMMATAMMTLLMTTMGPSMQNQKVIDTASRLELLEKTIMQAYEANSFSIDDNDSPSVKTAGYGKLTLRTVPDVVAIDSFCPNANATVSSQDMDDALNNIQSLQAYSSSSINSLSKDGYNNMMCIYISKRIKMNYAGAELYYHNIAIISPGGNNKIDVSASTSSPGTMFKQVVAGDEYSPWTLSLGGDDTGVVYDGSKLAIKNYKITRDRLDKLANAYEVYFKARYNSRKNKELQYNYFYGSGVTNPPLTGDLGEPKEDINPTQPTLPGPPVTPNYMSYDPIPERGFAVPTAQNVSVPGQLTFLVDSGIWYTLGINDSDMLDAWGRQIYVDNYSQRIRRPPTYGAPFTAQFLSLLPGSGSCTDLTACKQIAISTSIGTY